MFCLHLPAKHTIHCISAINPKTKLIDSMDIRTKVKQPVLLFQLAVAAAVSTACGSATRSRDNTINIAADASARLGLADVTEVIGFTTICSPDSCLIEHVTKAVRIPGGYALLNHSKEHPVVAYSDSGRFMCSFGRIGNGPGEYTYVEDIALSPRGDSLLVSTWTSEVYSYALDGTFGRSVIVDDSIGFCKVATNSNGIALFSPNLVEGFNSLSLYSPQGKKKFSGLPSSGHFGYPFFCRLPIDNEFVYALDWYENILYQITTSGDSVSNSWTINMPNGVASRNFPDLDAFLSNSIDVDYIIDWSVANGRFVAVCFYDKGPRYIEYDLERNEMVRQGSYVNCLPDFTPAGDDGYFITIIRDDNYKWIEENLPEGVELPPFDSEATDAILMLWRLKTKE